MTKCLLILVIMLAAILAILKLSRLEAEEQKGVYACPECGTLFSSGFNGRHCPEDGAILIYTGYEKWEHYKENKQ